MGIVHKNANFCGSETDFSLREKIFHGEKKLPVQQQKNGFRSAPNTHETYGVRSHAAIALLGHVIVKTVTCCCSRGLKTGFNTVILFQLRKSEFYKCFESEFQVGPPPPPPPPHPPPPPPPPPNSSFQCSFVKLRRGRGGQDFSFPFKSIPMPGFI